MSATFSRSPHRRLSEQVLDRVKQEIISGVLTPNMRLSEFDLAERLKVSRTPVREALIKLAEDGLVRIVPQVGTFVAPISVASVREAQFIREHLECAVVADAATCLTEKTLKVLRDNLRRQALAAEDNDWESFYALDEAMHETLAIAAGHDATWRIVQQSKTQFDRVRFLSFHMPHHMPQMIAQHTRIVDAVANGDANEASAAMRQHLREVLATLERLGLKEACGVIEP
jgi:DNA-binding GntR family transcriptional regulator